ncbi:MAG: chlorite dismutase family protein [Sandaracinaceae bacterium]
MSEAESAGRPPGLPEIDINEYGGKKDGARQVMDRRLFMQLLVYDCPASVDPEEPTQALIEGVDAAGIGAVVYEDMNAPHGLGLLTWSEDPADFVTKVRPIFRGKGLRGLAPRTDFTMIGRSYSSGYERDLEHYLLRRSVENVTNPEWPWAVWYPLRRSGAFAQLAREEQANILREHASIGMAYGAQELAHDVRLACHGLDARDNEFLIGLVGNNLHRLSHVVERMRGTKQTSEYIVQMGPFFVGHARHQTTGRA